ncbi:MULTISPECIES: YdcF family protein [unclassified Paenibacillus]|uniref:YdcF family protein n=1 Tax=unclassified Paenibacillus TaxID=185978 RepID=UPI001E2F2584|nr:MULTISPECIES: YdcF family protein [unclassified Paenibacillus]CAH0121143.1 hypothetical protein PAE9249_03669 [Paenibacillus sp. CECT 9249]
MNVHIARKRRTPARKRIALLILFVAVCGLLWFGYTQWIIRTAADSPLPARSDVGIVLGASLWNDRPSPGLAERLDHALSLYKRGVFRKIIVTGGLDSPEMTLTEAQGMQQYLVERGVPPEDVYLENEATSTLENLLFSSRIMADHNWTSAIVVTHSFHGARALEIARFLGYADPVVSTIESRVLNMLWYQTRESLAYTKWKLDRLLISLRLKTANM